MVGLSVFETRPMLQYLVSALLIFLVLFRMPVLSSGLSLNLAHRDLSHWTPVLPDDQGRHLLERAVDLGEGAGPRWFARGHGQRACGLLAQMQSQAWVDRSRGWEAFETGQQLEAQGQIDAAVAAYEEAVSQIQLRVLSLHAIYRLLETSDPTGAEHHLQRLGALEPAVQARWSVNDHYQLLGFDLDEWSIAWDGAHILITLYWQVRLSVEGSRQWGAEDWQYIQVGDRVYQIGTVNNLLPNGGFEQDLSTVAALPTGYVNIRDSRLRETGEIADFLRQYHSLLQDLRDGDVSQVAAMTAPPEVANGFSAPRVPVEEGTLYLLSGWMRTTGDSEGYLAGVWEKGKTELEYWRIADWSSHSSWRQYTAVAVPPREAGRFRFVALQRGTGNALFDEVLFCELRQPDLRSAGD